jgi:hypothetical protein
MLHDRPDAYAARQEQSFSLQDVRDAARAGDLGYTAGYVKKVSGSFGKASRLMYGGRPLKEVRADLDAFDAHWFWRKGQPLPGRFRDAAHFERVRSQIRGALSRFLGETARRAMLREADDDWRLVIDRLEVAVKDPSSPLCGKSLIPLTTLARIARDDHLQPRALTSAWLERKSNAIQNAGTRDSLRSAARLLDLSRYCQGLGIGHVLPTASLDIAPPGRRNRKNIVVPTYEDAMAQWKRHRVVGRTSWLSGLPIDPVSDSTADKDLAAIRWYITCAAELGLVDPDNPPPIEQLADIEIIKACAIAEVQRKRRWRPLKPSALHGHLRRLLPFLRSMDPEIDEIREDLLDDPYFAGIQNMTPQIKSFCIDFISDEQKQVRLFTLPIILQERAKAMLSRWNTLTREEQFAALGIAIAATEAAIITFIPFRAENIDQLTIYGNNPHVQRPSGKKRNIIDIYLPAFFVKNDVPISATIESCSYCNSRSILDWFIDDVRKKIPEMFPSAPLDADRLFYGLGYFRLHRYWSRATALAGIPMTQHRVRHAIASFILMEQDGQMSYVAAILCITEEVAKKRYGFIDKARRLQQAHTYKNMKVEKLVARHGARFFKAPVLPV